MRLGYKFYWSDWTGHPNHHGTASFFKALARHPTVKRWHILGPASVENTRSKFIVPLSAPRDSGPADASELESREPFAISKPAHASLLRHP